jgi:hypothetical protein
MNKLTAVFVILIFCLSSCQKDDPTANEALPQWLIEKNQSDEDFVIQNPKSMLAYGVWVRTTWEGDFYFEYSNSLSSSMYSPISFERDTLPFLIADSNTDYFKQKCCSEVVWYGSRIDEEYLALFHGK